MLKVTFPHMGTSVHPIAVLFEGLGNDVIVPTEPTDRTLNLGTKYAPEFACLPLKITLGTYIEGLRRGANAIVTSGGVGPCRAGYYSAVQEQILDSLGFDFRMIVFEPPLSHVPETFEAVKLLNRARLSVPALGWLLYRVSVELVALDRLELALRKVAPREVTRGTTEARYRQAAEMVRSARNPREIREAEKEGMSLIRSTPQDERADPVRVGLVGEIYVLLEPASNLYMERILGELGAEVHKSMYLTRWLMGNVVVEGGGFDARRAAAPYLPEMVGGHGQDSVGNTVIFAKRGLDGVIQLAPFTCIPEIVAKAVLERVTKDHSIPVLSFFLDEQTGETGVRTRLEAFVDMLRAKRSRAARTGPVPGRCRLPTKVAS